MPQKELINRLNRAIGQIEAIKKNLQEKPQNCVETILLTKAAIQALKKFAQAYLEEHLHACCVSDQAKDELEGNLREVIQSLFSL